MLEAPTFTCSICGEKSHDICVYCTKDTCPNHVCERCRRCVDCCVCEMPLTLTPQEEPHEEVPHESAPAEPFQAQRVENLGEPGPTPSLNGFGYPPED